MVDCISSYHDISLSIIDVYFKGLQNSQSLLISTYTQSIRFEEALIFETYRTCLSHRVKNTMERQESSSFTWQLYDSQREIRQQVNLIHNLEKYLKFFMIFYNIILPVISAFPKFNFDDFSGRTLRTFHFSNLPRNASMSHSGDFESRDWPRTTGDKSETRGMASGPAQRSPSVGQTSW